MSEPEVVGEPEVVKHPWLTRILLRRPVCNGAFVAVLLKEPTMLQDDLLPERAVSANVPCPNCAALSAAARALAQALKYYDNDTGAVFAVLDAARSLVAALPPEPHCA